LRLRPHPQCEGWFRRASPLQQAIADFYRAWEAYNALCSERGNAGISKEEEGAYRAKLDDELEPFIIATDPETIEDAIALIDFTHWRTTDLVHEELTDSSHEKTVRFLGRGLVHREDAA
jgi:hypothetical protein